MELIFAYLVLVVSIPSSNLSYQACSGGQPLVHKPGVAATATAAAEGGGDEEKEVAEDDADVAEDSRRAGDNHGGGGGGGGGDDDDDSRDEDKDGTKADDADDTAEDGDRGGGEDSDGGNRSDNGSDGSSSGGGGSSSSSSSSSSEEEDDDADSDYTEFGAGSLTEDDDGDSEGYDDEDDGVTLGPLDEFCPICHELFDSPVKTQCDHSFCQVRLFRVALWLVLPARIVVSARMVVHPISRIVTAGLHHDGSHSSLSCARRALHRSEIYPYDQVLGKWLRGVCMFPVTNEMVAATSQI